jgi:hypothetical protein
MASMNHRPGETDNTVMPGLLLGVTRFAIFDYRDDNRVSVRGMGHSGMTKFPQSQRDRPRVEWRFFIDNGGLPLPRDWVLEIYVEGKLLSLGAFVIEDLEAELK